MHLVLNGNDDVACTLCTVSFATRESWITLVFDMNANRGDDEQQDTGCDGLIISRKPSQCGDDSLMSHKQDSTFHCLLFLRSCSHAMKHMLNRSKQCVRPSDQHGTNTGIRFWVNAFTLHPTHAMQSDFTGTWCHYNGIYDIYAAFFFVSVGATLRRPSLRSVCRGFPLRRGSPLRVGRS